MYIPFAALGYEAAPKRISGNICRNRFAGRKGSFHSWGLVEGSYKEQKHWAEMILLPEGARVPVDRLNRFINFCGHTTLLQNAVAREQRFTDLLTSASSIVGSDEHILSAWRIHVEQADSYMAFHRTIDRIMTASPRHSFAPVEPAEGICPDPRLFRFPISLSPAEEEFLVRIRLEQLLK